MTKKPVGPATEELLPRVRALARRCNEHLLSEKLQVAALTLAPLRCEATCRDDVSLYGDQRRIKQVIAILIDNAIKYTPSDGKTQDKKLVIG